MRLFTTCGVLRHPAHSQYSNNLHDWHGLQPTAPPVPLQDWHGRIILLCRVLLLPGKQLLASLSQLAATRANNSLLALFRAQVKDRQRLLDSASVNALTLVQLPFQLLRLVGNLLNTYEQMPCICELESAFFGGVGPRRLPVELDESAIPGRLPRLAWTLAGLPTAGRPLKTCYGWRSRCGQRCCRDASIAVERLLLVALPSLV